MTLRQLNRTNPGGGRELGSPYAGVLGSSIPAGPAGRPPWMYPSLVLPADATKRYRYWIESHNFPFGLPLAPDSTGVIEGLGPGSYTATVWLYEEDVLLTPAFLVTHVVAAAPGLPIILAQPSPVTVTVGQQPTFTFATLDADAVQAQRRASLTAPWVNVPGATLTGYTAPAATSNDNGAQFRFAISGPGGGPIYTDIVTLAVSTIAPAPVNPVTWEEMLFRVMPYVGDCPRQTALFHLRQTAIDFFQRTLCWREDLPPITTIVDQVDYLLVLPEQTAMAKLLGYNLNQRRVAVIDAEIGLSLRLQQDGREIAWTVDRNTVSISPALEAGRQLVFRAALKPSLTANVLPALLYEHYIDHIVDGALARILALPRQTYTDSKLASEHRKAYELAIARIPLATSKGFRSAGRRSSSNPSRFM